MQIYSNNHNKVYHAIYINCNLIFDKNALFPRKKIPADGRIIRLRGKWFLLCGDYSTSVPQRFLASL